MPSANVEELLAGLTVEEKVSLLSGADGWHTQEIPRLGIGAIKVE
jgi:beta-glucosidase